MKFITKNFAKISVFNIVFAVILTSCSSSSASTSSSSTSSTPKNTTTTKSEPSSTADKSAIDSKLRTNEATPQLMRLDTKTINSSTKKDQYRSSQDKK